MTTKAGPVIRRSVAAALLQVTSHRLDKLKLRCWREGRTTFYDPEQIAALLDYRAKWMKARRPS